MYKVVVRFDHCKQNTAITLPMHADVLTFDAKILRTLDVHVNVNSSVPQRPNNEP